MSIPNFVTKTLWALPLLLQTAIALSMLRSRLVSKLPIFFAYTVQELFIGTALLFFNTAGNRYALIYWCDEAVAVLLGLLIIFEVLGHTLPKSSSLTFVQRSVWILAAMAAIAALLMLTLAKPGTGQDPMYDMIVLGERSVRFLQAFLLIVVIALMSRLGLSWRDESVGITAGFGVYSALVLVDYELGAHLHLMSSTAYVLLNTAGYNVAAMIWAFYILRPVRVIPIEHLPKTDLAEWNSAVTDYVDQWSRRY